MTVPVAASIKRAGPERRRSSGSRKCVM
jgi:hypothetical protein